MSAHLARLKRAALAAHGSHPSGQDPVITAAFATLRRELASVDPSTVTDADRQAVADFLDGLHPDERHPGAR